MASKVAHKSSYHNLVCDTQLETTYGNVQMHIWRKMLRNRHSVNTNIGRKNEGSRIIEFELAEVSI